MNCRQARRSIADHETGAWTAPLESHVNACAACRQWRARDAKLRGLLRLKRYERPDDHLETRLVARVRGAIAARGAARGAIRWREAFPTFSLPIGRFGIAALFIGMVTFQFLAAPEPTSMVIEPTGRHSVALGGAWPVAPSLHRFDAPRADLLAIRQPWTESSPLSVNHLGSAGVHYGIGFRRVVDER